MNKILRKNIMM